MLNIDGSALVRRIDAYCAMHGISKEAFSRETGISSANLSQWRTGVNNPSMKKVRALESFVHMQIEDFMQERIDPPRSVVPVCPVPFTDIFKRNVSAEVATLSHMDIEDSGRDYSELMKLLKKGSPVSLEDACEISDWLGTPLDKLTSETYDPRKKIPPAEESAQGDELEAKLLDCISRMSEREKRVLLASFESLLRREQEPSASALRSFA